MKINLNIQKNYLKIFFKIIIIFFIFFYFLILIINIYYYLIDISCKSNKNYIILNNLNLNSKKNTIYFYTTTSCLEIEKKNISFIIKKNKIFFNKYHTKPIINIIRSNYILIPITQEQEQVNFYSGQNREEQKKTNFLKKIKFFFISSFASINNLFYNMSFKLKHDLNYFNYYKNNKEEEIQKLQKEFNLFLLQTPNKKDLELQELVLNKIITNLINIKEENIIKEIQKNIIELNVQIQSRKKFFNNNENISMKYFYINKNSNLTKYEILEKLIFHESFLKGQSLIKEIQLYFYKQEFNIKKNENIRYSSLHNKEEYLGCKEKKLKMLKIKTTKISNLINNIFIKK
jgi:hypothetical protein